MFLSQIAIGGIHMPSALTHATTVIWDLLPQPIGAKSLVPRGAMSLRGFASSGMPQLGMACLRAHCEHGFAQVAQSSSPALQHQ